MTCPWCCACAVTCLQGVDGSFMLANLPALRDSYAELKAFVLASKDGGLFAAQGVGAAGALHAFVQVCAQLLELFHCTPVCAGCPYSFDFPPGRMHRVLLGSQAILTAPLPSPAMHAACWCVHRVKFCEMAGMEAQSLARHKSPKGALAAISMKVRSQLAPLTPVVLDSIPGIGWSSKTRALERTSKEDAPVKLVPAQSLPRQPNTNARARHVQGPSTRSMLPFHFAAKPFHDLDPIAFVVHFKGPKPHHYVDFFRTDRCVRRAPMQPHRGASAAACRYSVEAGSVFFGVTRVHRERHTRSRC